MLKKDFLSPINSVDWWSLDGIAITHCNFNPEAYDDGLYQSLAVPLPISVSQAVPKRKAEFLAGRCCARAALACLDIEAYAIPIGDKRNPVWPENVKGSITHCGQTALVMVTKQPQVQGLGIDVEKIIEPKLMELIAAYILVLGESELISHSKIPEAELFTMIFSIKESFFKAAFPLVKNYFDFDAVSVLELNYERQEISVMLNYSLHERLQKGDRFVGNYQYLTAGFNGYKTVATALII